MHARAGARGEQCSGSFGSGRVVPPNICWARAAVGPSVRDSGLFFCYQSTASETPTSNAVFRRNCGDGKFLCRQPRRIDAFFYTNYGGPIAIEKMNRIQSVREYNYERETRKKQIKTDKNRQTFQRGRKRNNQKEKKKLHGMKEKTPVI